LRDALTRGFLIGEEIAHAKPRQEPRPGRGRYGVEPQRSERGGRESVIFNFGFLMFDYWRVRKWESENVVPRVRPRRWSG